MYLADNQFNSAAGFIKLKMIMNHLHVCSAYLHGNSEFAFVLNLEVQCNIRKMSLHAN